ncbi:methyl-accepting chemotaxis protein [Rhizobium sp. TRM95796]|uniref:methyl-accepting chemotaxis protein n=1 Tax=Rhizobium sp. TRM95796 TaxID=2979862 RepID=UPI0021E75BF7|nr:methyl-accepting chemotaxis protein [Rhizobium sp. TRM95796]MCV3765429.1 methyl-accepting chemotaxis protein [Rhizobium sp. TRM95796]
MNALDQLRAKASYGVLTLIWANVMFSLAASVFLPEGGSYIGVVASASIAALVTSVWVRDKFGPTIRTLSSIGLAAEVAVLVYQFKGGAYQVDMHMYFFATLAICAAWIDWRAIIGFAAVVAVHHLVLDFLLPSAVFPGEFDFTRVLLHAVILILQSGVLIALTGAVVGSVEAASRSAADALAAHAEAAERAEEARRADAAVFEERTRREAEKTVEAEQTAKAVEQMAAGLTELSHGNLAYRLETKLSGRMDVLRQTFNQVIDQLDKTMREVSVAATHVRSGAESIREANNELSNRTERQAAGVEETAAAITEISETVQKTATRAENVNRLVENAKRGAEKSAEIVSNAVDAMSKIEGSSQQIGQIIGVIDEIAFQTNLLALNAGVEAARAGDAGKGFAVVATEVRELAQRSANAAKEIKTLINASADQVSHGVGLVGETGKALKNISDEVRAISEHVEQIVHATREQSAGLSTISESVHMIDQGTQHNAAMVEESTAAVHALASEADALDRLIEQFRAGAAARRHNGRLAA